MMKHEYTSFKVNSMIDVCLDRSNMEVEIHFDENYCCSVGDSNDIIVTLDKQTALAIAKAIKDIYEY